MSKLSFRARALDASKPMPIYLAEELPDLPDYSAINRAVPQMPSGMEKEEESEHHLQSAISGTGLIIPTPEVCEVTDLEFYERCYPPDYKMPKQHIHMQPLWEEQEAPEYDIDSEDERWLKQQRHPELTELLFEQMMDKLEKCSGQTVVTLNEAKLLLDRKHDLVIAVYDYWLNKRLTTQHPLILSVKTESRPGQSTNNPYLAFRRRTEKMQTRKNRKNDESSYEKMLKLRRDLARALTLLQLVARREQAKRELLKLTAQVSERRYHAGDFAQLVPEIQPRPMAVSARREAFTVQFTPRPPQPATDIPRQREKRPYKRRKHRHHVVGVVHPPREVGSSGGGGTSSEEETPDSGPFAFRRKPGCYYEMPTSTLCGDPLDPEAATKEVMYQHELDERHRYTLTSLSHPSPRCIGFARRRIARGGRIAIDRLRTPLDDLWPRLDFNPPNTNRYRRDRDEEVEFETKAHRHPKELTRDYHTSGKHPWRHAFRQHLSKNSHLWLEDVKPNVDDVKPNLDDVKPSLDDVKLNLDDVKVLKQNYEDVKMDVDNIPQTSDINVRTLSDLNDLSVKIDIDSAVKDNLDSVLRKRSLSLCSDTSYDSDESLYPVEKEFEQFFSEVNKKWLHFRPVSPPTSPPPPTPLPLPPSRPFRVQLLAADLDFHTNDLMLEELRSGRGYCDYLDGLDTGLDTKMGLLDDPSDVFLGVQSDVSGGVGGECPPLGSSVVSVRGLCEPVPAPETSLPHRQELPTPVKPTPTPTKVTKVEKTPQKKTQTPVREKKESRESVKEREKEKLVAGNCADETKDSTPTKPEKKKQPTETIEEVVVSQGVHLKTVQTRHSPLRKHIISSSRRSPPVTSVTGVTSVTAVTSQSPQQILTVAVSESLKVRLQNHLLSTSGTGGGAVVGLVQNGPFSPQTAPLAPLAVIQQPHHHTANASVVVASPTVSVSGATRRVSAPLVLGGTVGTVGGPPVVLAPSHTIHHVHPNKLKVLHAHALQRNQVGVGRGGVVSLSAAGVGVGAAVGGGGGVAHPATTHAPPLTHFFEIKAGHLAKGPHLVNVVRQPAAGKTTVARLELNDAKKRQVVATFDAAALKGNIASVRNASRVNVNVEGRSVGHGVPVVSVGGGVGVGSVGVGVAPVVRAALPAVRAHQLRHQIHLKNRTFQVATPIARTNLSAVSSGVGSVGGVGGAHAHAGVTVSGEGSTTALPSSLVANLLHKNIHLPKGGQKIAISGAGSGTVSGVQAIALSAHHLKRHARLVAAPRPRHTESGEGSGGASADDDDMRRRPNDTPMEVT